jgi:hypothetical protein
LSYRVERGQTIKEYFRARKRGQTEPTNPGSTLRDGGERLDEADASFPDSELVPERLMGAGPGLDDGDRPAQFVACPHVLEQDDVVRSRATEILSIPVFGT